MTNKKNNHTEGFTIPEVLIAITVGTMLLGLVLAIYTLTIQSLNSSQSRSELSQNSRIIFERVSRDIRQTRDIATVLPPDADDPINPPPDDIELQDGHQIDFFQYVRYYLDGTDIRRQVRRYYFAEDPGVLVPYDAEDDFGNPPLITIVSDNLVGQYVTAIGFYGIDLITVELTLQKGSVIHPTATQIFGRNL